jgi:tripartite-type tricarboxylate transporter receptor subunit TctC
VHFIVSFAAGGPNDTIARILGQYLSEYLGQQFVVENRVGAGGNIGMEVVLSSPPDGYTIGFVAPNNAINTTLYEHLPFDFLRDSTPVAGTMKLANIMDVNLSFPAKNLAEFIAMAKTSPGKINFASGGVGTSPHMSGELLQAMAGIKLTHVPYRGTARAMTDLLGGQVPVLFDNLPGSIQQIQSGHIRALGVTTAKRIDMLPDVPANRRDCPRLRGIRLVWHLRAQRHAAGGDREAQQSGQCRASESEVDRALSRAWWRAHADDTGRVRKTGDP